MKLIDIAFDLDGTLIHIMPVFEDIIWKMYKAKIPNNRNFRIKTKPELDYKTIMWCFGEAFKRINDLKIAKGVRELFKQLYELSDDDPIKIVTARPYSSAEWTHKLVERICEGICEWEVVLVKNGDNKIKHLNRYAHFVDDRRKTALHLESCGKTVWVPMKNYNRPMPDRRGIMLINSIEDLVPWAAGFIKEWRRL